MHLRYSQPREPSRDERPVMSRQCRGLDAWPQAHSSSLALLPRSVFVLLLLWLPCVLLTIPFQHVASRRAPCLGASRCPAAVWLARNSLFALKQKSLFHPAVLTPTRQNQTLCSSPGLGLLFTSASPCAVDHTQRFWLLPRRGFRCVCP